MVYKNAYLLQVTNICSTNGSEKTRIASYFPTICIVYALLNIHSMHISINVALIYCSIGYLFGKA